MLDPTTYVWFGWLAGCAPLLHPTGLVVGSLSPQFLRRFWLRRVLRIYPEVWAELLVLLLVAGAIPGLVPQASYYTLPFQFILWANLPPVMVQPLNGVWWTLPVELGFTLCCRCWGR